MDFPKKLIQVNLSTLLLLMLIIALVINGLSARSTIDKQNQLIEKYEKHLPEYNIALRISELNAEYLESRTLYGDTHPLVRKLELEIDDLERQRERLELRRAALENAPK